MIIRHPSYFRLRVLLLWGSISSTLLTTAEAQTVIAFGFVDPAECFNTLVGADTNDDGVLSAPEYVLFAETYTKSSLGSSFADLPVSFIATFNRLAWDCSSCTDTKDPNCCPDANGTLEIPATDAAVDYDLCSSTLRAADATLAPTAVPVPVPTPVPTATPTTVSPTATPTTAAPTVRPTLAPTQVATVTVSYDIAIADGSTLLQDDAFVNEYRANVRIAVDDLAVATASVRRRHLLSVLGDSMLDTNVLAACPENIEGYTYAPDDICETIQHELFLTVSNQDDPELFTSNLKTSILADLQTLLDQASWSTVAGNPITVLTGLGTVRATLGGGAIGGISAAAALLLIIPAAYLLYRRGGGGGKKDNQQEVQDGDPDVEVLGASMDTSGEHQQLDETGGLLTLGASSPNYGKHGDVLAEPGLLDADDTSSNAGSSGWSSSAGISSLNTGSMDDEGATLTGIGVASAFTRKNLDSAGEDSDHTPSRDQLDALIESGDWAAVGATAALLAAASDSQSERSSRADSAADVQEAAELDDLVDAGDWEGVVAAAAKFEASAGTGSQSRTTTNSMESTGTGQSTLSNSVGDTPSKVQKREEVRAEVEALVRRVVPEEIDNVDEMMNQFKGREEELVETLRTMQERAVAQKARAAGHKAAKQEARRNVKRGAADTGKGAVIKKVTSLEIKEAASGSGGAAKSGQGISNAANLRDNMKENPRSALEEAIEAGDWEAVGEAAALISDSSVTTADTAEIQRLAGTNLSISTSGSRSSRANMSGVQAERAAELDQLIDSGDWTAVMAAAKGYNETDRSDAAAGNRSKEEEEALKEAEHWMKIAEKTKGTDTGASNAAEWAIQRSLTELKKAEKKSEDKSGEDEV